MIFLYEKSHTNYIGLPRRRIKKDYSSAEIKRKITKGEEMRYVTDFLQLADLLYPELTLDVAETILTVENNVWYLQFKVGRRRNLLLKGILNSFYERIANRHRLVVVPSEDGMKIKEIGNRFDL